MPVDPTAPTGSVIARVLYEYAHGIDEADVGTLLELFASDAIIEYEGGQIHLEGAEEIRAYLTKILSGASSHLMSNLVIDQDDGSARIKASALVVVTRHAGFFQVRGASYRVALAQCDGRWKISSLFHQPTWEFRIPKTAEINL